jgi:transglutaminase-like putative cysteine protease
MSRTSVAAAFIICIVRSSGVAQSTPEWHMEYTQSHRATFEQEWKYTFPNHESTRWVIALRYPPELAWSKDVEGKAELLTAKGWVPFKEVRDGSPEHRRMLVIDHEHNGPMLKGGFTVRTTLTATIYDQHLRKGAPTKSIKPLAVEEQKNYLMETDTFDFEKPIVKKWMDQHKMWIGKSENRLDFVHRVYKELRLEIPYSMKDGGPWVCSQILKVGFGECCRHGIVGTSILRANKIPARTVCALWAIDNKSQGAHCWGEFFMQGVGWVPYDTTLGDDKKSEAYFANKKGELIAGMVDFDWQVEAGPFGKQTVFAVDAFPVFWSEGKGKLGDPKIDTKTSVRIVKQGR